jgi:gamma-glutamyl phosphate reductase
MFWKKKLKPKNPSREQIVKQAQQAMAEKREEIGDETLAEIQKAILKKESSVLEQSKRKIMAADEDKVRDNLSLLLKE